jgi:hypothetical protein
MLKLLGLKKLSGLLASALICSVFFVGGGAALADDSSEGFAFYLEFLKTAATADDLGEIAPLLPSWWRERYESADETTKADILERKSKLARDLQEVALDKAEAQDDGLRLHMTAKEQNGFPMRGNVLLVRESGSFVVEEEIWATSQ